MSPQQTLDQTYQSFLHQSGKLPLLEKFYREEDDYLERTHELLDNFGEAPLTSYGDVRAFSGGRAAATTLIQDVASAGRATANELGAEVPPVLCAHWPDPRPNSRTVRLSHGGCIVLFNTGLWQTIRFFSQWTALQVKNATGLPLAPGDDADVPDLRGVINRQMRSPAPWEGTVWVLAGQREFFRREMNYGALCWVIGHELGHASRRRPFKGGWSADNPLFNQGALIKDPGELESPNETQANDSFGAEFIADLIATRILRSAPFNFRDRPSIPFTMGCLAAQMVMADSWWQQAAHTDARLGWTHPAPDIRIQSIIHGFTTPMSELQAASAEDLKTSTATAKPETLVGLKFVVDRYRAWCEGLLEIAEAREVVWERGLADRGINPMSLVYLYTAYGKAMKQGPSDLLSAMKVLDEQ